MKILNQASVSTIVNSLPIEELLACSRRALIASSKGLCHCPPRLVINNGSFTSLHMPSELDKSIAEKVVSVPHSGNGLPASIQVLDRETGALKCLMNASMLTALRTAAASVLATLHAVRQNPHWRPVSLCVFGTGEQAFHHVRLHLLALDTLQRVVIVTRSKNAQYDKFMARLKQSLPTQISIFVTSEHHQVIEEVHRADIICCCTPSETPLFPHHTLRDKNTPTHINLIGSYKPTMHEIDTPTVLAAKVIWTDSTRDCLREAGELIDAVEAGLDQSKIVELGVAVEGQLPMSSTANSLSIFKCVGMSVMDNAMAQVVMEKAEEQRVGLTIDDF